MEKQFDVAIIGDNLQAALLIHETIVKGLSVAHLIIEDDKMLAENEPFIVFKYIEWVKLRKRIRQNRILHYLKTNATHLLLTTEIEEYKNLSVFELILFHFNNPFSKNSVKIKKLGNSDKLYQLNYSSYKISTNRLHQVILKSINSADFKTVRTNKLCKIKDNLEEIILSFKNNDELITKRVINTKKISPLKTPTSYFTYPNNSLKLEKTIFYNTKDISIEVIPWFEWVYFEIKGKEIPKTEENTISLIKKFLPEINIDKEDVLLFKKHQQSETVENTDNKEFNNVNLNILNNPDFKQTPSLLIGSDLGIPYHPLRIMEYCDEKYDEAKHILQNSQFFKKLFYRYGTEIDKITYQAYEFWNQTKDIKKTWLMAELWYLVNYEQCMSPNEFIYKHTEEWMNGKETDKELIKSLYEELTNKQ